MRKLDLSLTDTANTAEFTTGTIDFLQTSWAEGFSALIVQLIQSGSYSNSTVYVLWGCSKSVVGGNNVISEGYIFFNGEFFSCPQTTLSGTVGTIIANLLTTPYTTSYGGDPMQFSVTGPANVHNIRTVQFAYGTSGTGTISGTSASDYTNLVFLYPFEELGINQRSTFNGDTITMERSRISSYLNPIAGSTNVLTISNSILPRVGIECDLYAFNTGGGDIISFAGSFTCYILTGTSSLTFSTLGNNMIRIRCISLSRLTIEVFQNI